ncbi:MAG TPA: S8 family serine peptidase [bacterium]|nr:S8 family serine peptidase [bacterium]
MNIRKRLPILLILLFLAGPDLSAQPLQGLGKPVNRQALQQLEQELRIEMQTLYQQAREEALRKNWPLRIVTAEGRILELQRLAPNGMPLYYTTYNLDAAGTVRTDEVWPEGAAGLSLTGSGMVIGEWDGGQVLENHQELAERVTTLDRADTMGLSDHSTHVAGTLIATGIISQATGMAFEADLHAYDWNEDLAEMAAEADDELLVSNHSYGFSSGWVWNYKGDDRWAWLGDPDVDPEEDFLFGFYYSGSSRLWDEVIWNASKNASNYLPVVAAGNDRTDTGPAPGEVYWIYDPDVGDFVEASMDAPPPDGPYDCISHAALAKNVLTVGAVGDIPGGYTDTSDVNMTSFSSWGPADDGRIKPDIVANGVTLYSSLASGPGAYGYFSGTSMATPNAAGSLLLLQELYMKNHGGTPMRASTLKALAIHTADEAGNPGPDYEYGWGLLNTSKAAETIEQDSVNATILEGVLEEGRQFTVNIKLTSPKPLIATLCWTDPPGTSPLVTEVDPDTKALVNDLDMRIFDSDGSPYDPWTLNEDNPTASATTGDNQADNVEQVFIAAAQPDSYTVVISNDGPLQAGAQNFSLIVNSTAEPNDPPALVANIPDTTVDEDFGSLVLADLDTVFQDPEGAGLDYRAETNANIDARIQGSMLEIVSVQNAFGTGQVVVSADDMQSETSDTISVAIRPVNDPPLPFALQGPPDVFLNTASLKMPFTWEASADVEADTIRYLFRLTDSLAFDTTAVLEQPGLLLSVVPAGLPRNTPIHWDVQAADQQDTTQSSNGPFGFLLSPTLELSAFAGSEPEEFTLFQNFPNPFTGSYATTNIGYGLIERVPVWLTIYDARGYKVATLVNSVQSPGWHKVQWSGTDEQGQPVSAGVYIFQLVAGDFRAQKKLVILR